eukprot:51688-Alexandrium_andersonii.AAC.1
MQFLQAHYPGKFASFVEWKSAKAFKHKLVAEGLWTEFEEYLNNHCIFSDGSIDHGVVFSLLGGISS